METRRRYASDETDGHWGRFIETGTVGETWQEGSPFGWWTEQIGAQTAQGKRIERVRIVDQPATTGQRYLFDSARWNIAAGEDIRNMRRADVERLRLPAEDFWLFDSRLIALLRFDDDDQLTHVDLITEPAEVVRCCTVRDAAWHHAVPRQQAASSKPPGPPPHRLPRGLARVPGPVRVGAEPRETRQTSPEPSAAVSGKQPLDR